MKASTKDRLGSGLALLFAASLWLQRNYTTPFDGIFPDAVMVVLTLIVVATLVLSFTSQAAMRDAGAEDEPKQKTDWTSMAVVGAILLAWAVLLRKLGFAVTGVLGFAAISWYLAGLPKDLKAIGRSFVVAALVTGVLMLVFGRLLRVPLPPGTVFT